MMCCVNFLSVFQLPPVMLEAGKAGTWWHHQALMVAGIKYGIDVARLMTKLFSRAAEGGISLGSLAKVRAG